MERGFIYGPSPTLCSCYLSLHLRFRYLARGASQSAGLPTAWDMMWDLKRLHYNLKENQQISPNDVQNRAVQEKIEAHMEAQGFLPAGDPEGSILHALN